jgi:thioredoxin 1
MPSQNVVSSEFELLINENKIVFVDFWADWCAPCKQFASIYEQISEQFPSVTFAKVNIEAEQELADFFEIRSIPHLMVFKEGIVIYSNAGSMPASTLHELVEQALVADVSAIKAQFEQDEKQQ